MAAATGARAADHQEGAGRPADDARQEACLVRAEPDRSPEARDILLQTARSADPALRGEAIRSIGISGDDKSLDALQTVYASGDADVKKQVLQAWMIAGRKARVYQAALNAKTEDEAGEAIHMLGVMGAAMSCASSATGRTLRTGWWTRMRSAAISPSLRKIADGNGSNVVRVEAVRRSASSTATQLARALREIYTRSTDEEIKEAALQGMLIAQRRARACLRCTAPRRPPRRSATLLRTLTMMDGDAALEAIDAALENKR